MPISETQLIVQCSGGSTSGITFLPQLLHDNHMHSLKLHACSCATGFWQLFFAKHKSVELAYLSNPIPTSL